MPSWLTGGGSDRGATDSGVTSSQLPTEGIENEQCDDGMACYGFTWCADGRCVYPANSTVCPRDGVFGNGPEVCDAISGCRSAGNPCGGAWASEGNEGVVGLPPLVSRCPRPIPGDRSAYDIARDLGGVATGENRLARGHGEVRRIALEQRKCRSYSCRRSPAAAFPDDHAMGCDGVRDWTGCRPVDGLRGSRGLRAGGLAGVDRPDRHDHGSLGGYRGASTRGGRLPMGS